MYPELFKIPFINLTVWNYGLMMVLGFLAAIFIIRTLSRDITPSPELITNAALYSLIAGIVGARLFYVVHHWDKFKGHWSSILAIWNGGLELLGGVVLALVVIWLYIRRHKLPFRRYADILAIGLMAALAFGRIGCFLNGCCFGKPANLPWAVRFPYASPAYLSQVKPDLERNRLEPHLKLPARFFGHIDYEGKWKPAYGGGLKPFELLTAKEKYHVTEGKLRCLSVHPTQIYSSLNAAVLGLVLYLIWRRSRHLEHTGQAGKLLTKPGCVFGLMFVLYGTTRFFIEFLRDDNPFEIDSLTVSQNLGIGLVALGVVLVIIFVTARPNKIGF